MSATRTALSTPRTARLRLAAGLSWLLLAPQLAPAVAQPIDEVPANTVYMMEKSREKLEPGPTFKSAGREAVTEWHAKGMLRVKFQDGTPIHLEGGELVEPWIDLPGLGLGESKWTPSWVGSVDERVALWKGAEKKTGQRLADPTSFYILHLPEGVSVADAIERLGPVEEVEAVWPLAPLKEGPPKRDGVVATPAGPFEKGGQDPVADFAATEAWRLFGSTGRFANIAFVSNSLPSAGASDLPPYSTVGSVFFAGPYGEIYLRIAGAQINGIAGEGIAPHARYQYISTLGINQPDDDGNQQVYFDPAAAISRGGQAVDSGGFVVVPYCLQVVDTEGPVQNPVPGDDFWLGCLPVEADPAVWAEIRIQTGNGVNVVETSGNQLDEFGHPLPRDLSGQPGVSPPIVPPGFTNPGPFGWQHGPGGPTFPLHSGAMIVNGIYPGTQVPTGNFGLRVNRTTWNYFSNDIFEAPAAIAASMALVESAYQQIGISTDSPANGVVWPAEYLPQTLNLYRPQFAINEILYRAFNTPRPSLRLHTPVTGYAATVPRDEQNKAIRNNDLLKFPGHVLGLPPPPACGNQSLNCSIHALSLFNDGSTQLTTTATIEYDGPSNPQLENPFSVLDLPAVLESKSMAEPKIRFEPREAGTYHATLVLATNDPRMFGQPFRVRLEVEATGTGGLVYQLLDVDNVPFPEGVVYFGDLDWHPEPNILEEIFADQAAATRGIRITNRSNTTIEVKLDYPEVQSECMFPFDSSQLGMHFIRVHPVGLNGADPVNCGTSLVYKVVPNSYETVFFAFRRVGIAPLVTSIPVTFQARPHNSGGPWDAPRSLTLRGEIRDWPEEYAMRGPDGKIRFTSNQVFWDAGDVEVNDLQELLSTQRAEFWSKTEKVHKNIQTVGGVLPGDDKKDLLPASLKFTKTLFSYVEAAQAVVELTQDANTVVGNAVRRWAVEVDASPSGPFYLEYSVRPWKNTPAASYTFSFEAERVKIEPNKKSKSASALLPAEKFSGTNVDIGMRHNFGKINSGTAVSETYWINNRSTHEIRVAALWVEGEGFSATLSGEAIPPGEAAQLIVTFSGGAPGVYEGYLSFRIDGESTNPFYLGQLVGEVSRPTQPVAVLRTDSGKLVVKGGRHEFPPIVRASLPPVSRTFTLTNQGLGTLRAYNLHLSNAPGVHLPTGQQFNVELETDESATFSVLMDRDIARTLRDVVQFDTNVTGTFSFEVVMEVKQADVSGFELSDPETGEIVPPGGVVEVADTATHGESLHPLTLRNGSPYEVQVGCYDGRDGFRCIGTPVRLSPGATSQQVALQFAPDYPGRHEWSTKLELKFKVTDSGQVESRPFDVIFRGSATEAPGSSAIRIEDVSGAEIAHGGTLFLGQGEPYDRLESRLRVKNVGGVPVTLTGLGRTCYVTNQGWDFDVEPWQQGPLAPSAVWEPNVRLTRPAAGSYSCYLYADQFHVRLAAVLGDGLTLTLPDGSVLDDGGTVSFPETLLSVDRTLVARLRNEGLRLLDISGVTVVGGAAFSLVGSPSGMLQAGESRDVELVLSADSPGTFLDELRVAFTDEGVTRQRTFRLRGWVRPDGDPAPLLEVTGWGAGSYWHGDSLPLREGGGFGILWGPQIRNSGDEPLQILSVTASDPAITVTHPHDPIEPGGTREVNIKWASRPTGQYEATVSIASNDPFSPLQLKIPARFYDAGPLQLRRPNGSVVPMGTTVNLGQLWRCTFGPHDDVVGFSVYNAGSVPAWIRYNGEGNIYSQSAFTHRIEPGQSESLALLYACRNPAISGRLKVSWGEGAADSNTWQFVGTTNPTSEGPRPVLSVFPLYERSRPIRSGDKHFLVNATEHWGATYQFSLQLENNGEQELDIDSVTVTGAGWRIERPLDDTTLNGNFEDLGLEFDTHGPGWHDGQLRVVSNATNSPFVAGLRVLLLGDGPIARLADIYELFTARSGTYSFPTVKPNTAATRALFIHNFGNYPVRLTSPVTLTGDGFTLTQGLPAGTVIEPGKSAAFRVTFLMAAEGTYNGSVSFGTNEGLGAFTISLQSKVSLVATHPGDEFGEADLRVVRDWDGADVGAGATVTWEEPTPPGQSTSRRFRIENVGGADLELGQAVQLAGDCFHLIEEPSTVIAGGDVGYFRVRVLCGTEGPKAGTVTIFSNDADQPVFTFQLAAEVASERAVISVYRDWDDQPVANGGSYTFDVEPLAGIWTSKLFRIENPGFAELVLANPSGLVSGDCFALTHEPAATVAEGESTVFRVRLACSQPGPKTGSVTIQSTDPRVPPFVFQLAGTVHERQADIRIVRTWDDAVIPDGGSFAFPDPVTAPNVTSRRFRIDNPGTADLTLASTVDLVSGTCFSLIESPAAVVPAGGNAFFRVRLGCHIPGVHQGTVTVSSADGTLTHSFAVVGEVEAAQSLVTVRRGWDGVVVPRGSTVTLPGTYTLEQETGGATFVVENPTNDPLYLIDPSTSIQGACYRLDPAAGPPPTVVPAHGYIDLRVQVHCTVPGVQTGELRLYSSLDGVTAAGSYSAALQATVVEPEMKVTRGWNEAAAAGTIAYEVPETRFFTLPPCRLYDTRVAAQGPAMTAGETRNVQVTGQCGIPSDAVAVSFNFVVFTPTSNGYLRVFPADRPDSLTTTLNFFANTNRAAQAIRRLSIDGSGRIGLFLMPHSSAYTAHVIADVNGYFSASDVANGTGATGPMTYSTLPACRVADTRLTTPIQPSSPLQSGVPRKFDVRGVCGVPTTARAALLNLTALNATTLSGNLNLYPSDIPTPTTVSTLNLIGAAVSTNNAVTNGALVRLGSSPGDVSVVYNGFDPAATSHAVLDGLGYFQASEAGGLRYFPLESGCRALDTRLGGGAPLGNVPLSLSLRGPCGIPPEATALAATVSVVTPNGEGYLKLYPSGSAAPLPPVATFWAGSNALAHGTILPLGPQPTNEVTGQFFNFGTNPATHLVIDVFGYLQRPIEPGGTGKVLVPLEPAAGSPSDKAAVDREEILDGDVVELPVEAAPGDIHTSAPFQIHNVGAGDLYVTNAGTGMVSGECFYIRPDGAASGIVPPGGRTAFRVWWGTHCGPGEYPADVRVESNDADEDPLEFTVIGRVQLPAANVVVSRNWNNVVIPHGDDIPFPGSVVVNVPSAPAFLIHNPGTEAIQIPNAATAITGACYSAGLGDPVPAEVAPGATALFRVRLLCDTPGVKQGRVTLQLRKGAVAYRDYFFTITAMVTVPGLPELTPPEPQTVPQGGTATFTVTVTSPASYGPYTYAWQHRPPGAADFSTIAGATAPTLTLPGVTLAMSGTRYRCLVSNSAGQSNSGPAMLTVTNAPAITQPPTSQRVNAGTTVTFSVTATGSGPLTYAWKKNGVSISGATLSTLTLTNVTDADEGNYTVTVSNAFGSTPSPAVTLTVVNKPAVSQPQSITVSIGATASFSVTVSSPAADGPFTYAWQQLLPGAPDFTTMAGQVLPTLDLSAVTSAMSGARFRCLVANEAGQSNSGPATLTVSGAPTITQAPTPQRVVVGSTASFTVGASGTGLLSYAWKKDNLPIPGATGSTLTLAAVTDASEGQYNVVVTNSQGSVTSSSATLTVVNKPVVSQPQSTSVSASATASFSVVVSSPAADGPFTYAWQHLPPGAADFSTMSGATTPSLTVANVTMAMDGTRYRCLVSNEAGQSNSGPATLTVTSMPVITQAPVAQRVNAGATAVFTVEAAGSPPLAYQWRRNGVAVAGATQSSLTLAAATDAVEGSYTVVVSNTHGSVTSAAAALTVVNVPVITQPQSVSVAVGATANFSVTVTSPAADGPFIYAWQHLLPGAPDFSTISGATLPTLAIPGVTTAMSGTKYRCLVSNQAGQGNSGAGTLTVTSPLTITQAPASQKVNVNSTAVFTVAASGTGSLSYNWKKNGTTISGATASSLTLTGVTNASEGSYTVVVTDSQTSVTSAPASLTVVYLPVVSQPQSVTVAAGASPSFSVTVSSPAADGPFVYAWQHLPVGAPDFSTISGATSPSLLVSNVTASMDGTRYRCLVSNQAGQSNSGPATLTVTSAPSILQQPAPQRVSSGSTAVFSVTASGSSLTYSWRKNGVAIAGANGSSLTLTNVTDASEGSYTVVVSNSQGSVTSQPATLTVVYKPVVGLAQTTVSTVEGANATVTAVVSSPAEDGPFTYAWQQLMPGAPDFSTISGATSPALTLNGVTLAMNGAKYRCLVSNMAGQSNSGPATLQVTPSTVLATLLGDSYTDVKAPTTNYGNRTTLQIRSSTTNNQSHGYVRFSLSGLVGPITSAKLRLRCSTAVPSLSVYKIVDWPWTEMTLTYDNASINAPWSSLGHTCAIGQWLEVDVTTALTAGNGTYTFALSHGGDWNGLVYSKEGGSAAQLVVQQTSW